MRVGNPITRLQMLLVMLSCFILGCGPVVEIGKPLNFPKEKNAVIFGVRSAEVSAITNQDGRPIDGLILHDATLIRDAGELANSKNQHFVIFWSFLLGNGARGRYWEQQSERQPKLGTPFIDSRSSRVAVLTVGSNGRVTESESLKG